MVAAIRSLSDILESVNYGTNWMRDNFSPEEKATFQKANQDLSNINTLIEVEAEKLRKSEPFVKNGFGDEKFKPWIKMILMGELFKPSKEVDFNIKAVSEFLNIHSTTKNGLGAEAAKFARKYGEDKEGALKKAGIPIELANMPQFRNVAQVLNNNFILPPKVNVVVDNEAKSVHDLDGKAMVELAKLQIELNKAKPGSESFTSLTAQTKQLMQLRAAATQFNSNKMTFATFVAKTQDIQKELAKLPLPKSPGLFGKKTKEPESVKLVGDFLKANGDEAKVSMTPSKR
jgi:hypothetical protein